MFNWIKSFFSSPEVTKVVRVAQDATREAADSVIDAQVERQASKLKNKIRATNLAIAEKDALVAAIDGLLAAVKAAYGDRR